MNAPFETLLDRSRSIASAVDAATARIVPAWPLDRMIAVNPYEGHANRPIVDAESRLLWLCGTRLTMPRSWYCSEWQAGRLSHADLQAAVAQWLQGDDARHGCVAGEGSSTALVDELQAVLEHPEQEPAKPSVRLALATVLAEPAHLPGQPLHWADLVVHQVSQHCAAWFDDGQSAWRPDTRVGLYAGWRERIAFDRALPARPGRPPLRQLAAALPHDPLEVVAIVAEMLCIADGELEAWCEALLLDVGGWAAACAWRRRHQPSPEADPMEDLLGIRAGWEWLLMHDDPALAGRIRAARRQAAVLPAPAAAADLRTDWLLQCAVELAYSRPLCAALAGEGYLAPDPQGPGAGAPDPAGRDVQPAIAVQALFCIDVRSEPFRRALEATDPGVRTYGFAGFFGAPIAHLPLGTDVPSARVPGLLSPSLCATQTLDAAAAAGATHADARLADLRSRRLQDGRRFAAMRSAAASAFGFVESLGLSYAARLLRDSLPSVTREPRWEDHGLTPTEAGRLRLRLAESPGSCAAHERGHGSPAIPATSGSPSSGADLAERILGVLEAIGLRLPLAPLVLIAGHGSQNRNNPHAAGLDCGACGGHTGEVNARLLAGLLNDRDVRAELERRGTTIPDATWFIAGLHNTTTDELTLFEASRAPGTHAQAVAALAARLHEAGEIARRKRAPTVSPEMATLAPDRLLRELQVRGNDWAQTRPEWGLAGNAAFIAAPRARTAALDLGGRAFLHDYEWQHDPDLSGLELILSAPLVVANWINLQYYASTVDPVRYGSGNKLLHNVVGGHIGVFEGNGGDLRIGLPWQSVHDGERFRHLPLRLHAFIDAPACAIEAVFDRQPHVRRLIDHGWLHLFRLQQGTGATERWQLGTWRAVAVPAPTDGAAQPES